MHTNKDRVHEAAYQVSFLMEHQDILPDLKEIAAHLRPVRADNNAINRESPEYLLGAFEALNELISALEGKGC